MRDTGPILKDREIIVKNVGRAEKKARSLGGGLESMSGYRVVVRKEVCGRGI